MHIPRWISKRGTLSMLLLIYFRTLRLTLTLLALATAAFAKGRRGSGITSSSSSGGGGGGHLTTTGKIVVAVVVGELIVWEAVLD